MNKKWGSKARSEIYGDLWSVFVVCNLRFTSKFGRIRGRSGPQTVTAPGQPLNCIAIGRSNCRFLSVKAYIEIIRFFGSLPHNWGIGLTIWTVVRHVSFSSPPIRRCEARNVFSQFYTFSVKSPRLEQALWNFHPNGVNVRDLEIWSQSQSEIWI